jgi:phosphatidylglycerophosphatase A
MNDHASKNRDVDSSHRTFRQRLMLLVGSIGPLGHMPASGTVAVAVAGIPLAYLMGRYLPLGWYLAVTIAFTGFSIWLHDVGDRILGEKDSRKLVLDELAGFFFAMIAIPMDSPRTIWLLVIGFFLERGIDIAKVPPANVIENRLPGGWGVVGDDVVAGLYTMGILHLLMAVMGWS